MRYKYVITRYNTPVVVVDTKEDALALAKAVYCVDEEGAEDYVKEVLHVERKKGQEE